MEEVATGLTYAAKIVNTRDNEIVEGIITEFENLKRLNHPAIIKPKELLIDNLNGKVYYIMEYFKGTNLLALMDTEVELSEQKIRSLVRKIMAGIVYLHKNHVVHRDLKLTNILVRRDNRTGNLEIKIIDFNISKFADRAMPYCPHKPNNYLMNSHTGTIAFCAPEMFEEVCYSEPIDVWAVGCIVYTLAYGHQPFADNNIKSLINRIKFDKPFLLHHSKRVSLELIDLLSKMFAHDPIKRILAIDVLQHPWFQSHDEQPTDSEKGFVGLRFNVDDLCLQFNFKDLSLRSCRINSCM